LNWPYMPKYYCDYCDTYLTHDSTSVRKSHNEGWKHKAAVKNYYSQFGQDETQEIINARIKAYEQRTMYQPVAPGAYYPAPAGYGYPPPGGYSMGFAHPGYGQNRGMPH